MKRILLIAALAFTAGVNSQLFAQEQEEETVEVEQPKKPVRPQVKLVPTHEICGRVFDAATNQPASGVQVKVYNDMYHSAMTDEEGNYFINVPIHPLG